MESVGCHHVLNFNLDVAEFPCLNPCGTEITNHALDAGVDVVLVLSTGAYSTAGTEHQDGQLGVHHTVNYTWKLFRFILTIQLNCDIGEVQFLGHTGRGNYIHYCKTVFITGCHGCAVSKPLFKATPGITYNQISRNCLSVIRFRFVHREHPV